MLVQAGGEKQERLGSVLAIPVLLRNSGRGRGLPSPRQFWPSWSERVLSDNSHYVN